jgi:hypothetical protein
MVLKYGDTLPLSSASYLQKAAEDCRTPRRYRAGRSVMPVRGRDVRVQIRGSKLTANLITAREYARPTGGAAASPCLPMNPKKAGRALGVRLYTKK